MRWRTQRYGISDSETRPRIVIPPWRCNFFWEKLFDDLDVPIVALGDQPPHGVSLHVSFGIQQDVRPVVRQPALAAVPASQCPPPCARTSAGGGRRSRRRSRGIPAAAAATRRPRSESPSNRRPTAPPGRARSRLGPRPGAPVPNPCSTPSRRKRRGTDRRFARPIGVSSERG